MIKTFKDLEVYQTSYRLALLIYDICRDFPKEDSLEIKNQIKRAALSVPLNIAEGYGKKENINEFKRFLKIALGSSNEMLVLIDFIKDLGYIDESKYFKLKQGYEVLIKRLITLIKKWK